MITLVPIDDVAGAGGGWTATGGGERWEDIDDDPDSPDANYLHNSAGTGDLHILMHAIGVSDVTSIVARIKWECTGVCAISASVDQTLVNNTKFSTAVDVVNGLQEFNLLPDVATPYTIAGAVILVLRSVFVPTETLRIDAVELVLYQGDEPGGGGGSGPGGQQSRNAAFFLMMCGVP